MFPPETSAARGFHSVWQPLRGLFQAREESKEELGAERILGERGADDIAAVKERI